MLLRRTGSWLALILVLLSGAQSPGNVEAQESPERRQGKSIRTDRHGDPLPPGARARLGTVRLRNRFGMVNPTFSPDSRLIATTWHPSSFAGSRVLYLWERETGRLVHTLRDRGADDDAFFHRYAFTPDSKGLISGDSGGHWILFWDVASGAERRRLKGPGTELTALVVSRDGKLLACGDGKGTIRLWDVATGKVRRTISGPPLKALTFTADGKRIAFTADGKRMAILGIGESETDAAVRLVEVATGETLRRFTISGLGLPVLAPDGRTVWDDRALWNVATGLERPLPGGNRMASCELNFSPDGRTLLAADWEKETLLLGDLNSGAVRSVRVRGMVRERKMVLSPDGKTLATPANHWRELRLWDASTGRRLLDYSGHTSPPGALTFSPDGKTLASHTFADGMLRWDVATGRLLSQTASVRANPFGRDILMFSPDGSLAAQTEGDRIDLHDACTGRIVHHLRGHTKDVVGVSFSPNGQTLASASEDGTVRLWDVAKGRLIRTIDTRPRMKVVHWLLFSPDGGTVATGDGLLHVHLWSAVTGAHLARMDGDRARWKETSVDVLNWSCCFAPDGRTLFVSNAGNLQIWNMITRTETAPYEPEEDAPWTTTATGPLAVSPDGRLLARFDNTFTLRLWETASGKKVCRFAGDYCSVAFAPDSRTLATDCCKDGPILLWDLTELLRGREQDGKPPDGEHAHLWVKLADSDAPRAFRTVGRLMADEETGLAVLSKHLRPVPTATPEQLATLVKQLDSPLFAEREKARQRLEELREAAGPFLKRVKGEQVSLEVRRRVQAILEQLQPQAAERLREVRGVQVLEYLGTPAARRLLGRLAEGMPEARLTQEARASVQRLARRSTPPLREHPPPGRHPPGSRSQ